MALLDSREDFDCEHVVGEKCPDQEESGISAGALGFHHLMVRITGLLLRNLE